MGALQECTRETLAFARALGCLTPPRLWWGAHLSDPPRDCFGGKYTRTTPVFQGGLPGTLTLVRPPTPPPQPAGSLRSFEGSPPVDSEAPPRQQSARPHSDSPPSRRRFSPKVLRRPNQHVEEDRSLRGPKGEEGSGLAALRIGLGGHQAEACPPSGALPVLGGRQWGHLCACASSGRECQLLGRTRLLGNGS